MNAPSSPRKLDAFLAAFSRIALRIFFRRIEVEGLSRLPKDRPLLVVSNHGNGLVDPMILFGFLPRTPRFLAKSTLWQHPFARHVVRLGGAIPVYRKQDEGDMSQNESTFSRCFDMLAAGGTIAIFPEGISHAAPQLAELRTGAARIVLGAEERHGPLETLIVPVGLTFDERHLFRSSLLIQVGDPIDPQTAPSARESGRQRVQALTAEVEQGLRAVTLNYPSWDEAELVELATEVYLDLHPEQKESLGQASHLLGGRLPIRHQVLRSYNELQRVAPEELSRAVRATRSYRRLLRLAGLRHDQVDGYGLRVAARFAWRTLRLLFWTLPLAVIGLVINYPPYLVPRAIVKALRLPKDQQATYKVMPSVLIFPLVWGLLAVFAGRRLGLAGGLAALAIGPLSGYVALVFTERLRSFVKEARAYFLVRTKQKFSQALAQKREQVGRHLEELMALLAANESAP